MASLRNILTTPPYLELSIFILISDKSGCERSEMCPLVKYIREKCPCLQFMGLMTIGAYGYNLEDGPNPDFLVCYYERKVMYSHVHLRA